MNGTSRLPTNVFWLSAVAILAALGSVIVTLFVSTSSPYQYPITMALLCFALSSVSGLLFASRVEISGTIGLLGITIGGPAAMWVASLYIVYSLFPTPLVTPQSLIDVLRLAEKGRGWYTFQEWTNQLGELQVAIKQDEANQVRQILDTAYYVGAERKKPANVVVQLMYVYLDKQTIRFLHMSGKNVGTKDIYFKAHTTVTGATSSVMLARRGDVITASDTGGKGDWSQVSTDPIDCLVVTLYDEGMLAQGDLLYVNTTKYLGDGAMTLETGILAPQRITKPKVWQLHAFPFPHPSEVPVAFKLLPIRMEEKIEVLFAKFLPWMKLLNQRVNQQSNTDSLSKDARDFLQTVRDRLPERDFVAFVKSKSFKSTYSVRPAEGLTESAVITFSRS